MCSWGRAPDPGFGAGVDAETRPFGGRDEPVGASDAGPGVVGQQEVAVEIGPAGAVAEVDGGGDAQGAGGQAAQHQVCATAFEQGGDTQGRVDASAFGEFDVDAVDASGEPARVLVGDRVLVRDDGHGRAGGEPGECFRVSGG